MTSNNITATTDRNRYGAVEINGLVNPGAYHDSVDYTRILSLREVKAEGGKITRARLLTDYIPELGGRMVDVSYIHATLASGKIHPVQVLVGNLTPMHKFKGELIAWAKSEGVYAKGIGLLDDWSTVY